MLSFLVGNGPWVILKHKRWGEGGETFSSCNTSSSLFRPRPNCQTTRSPLSLPSPALLTDSSIVCCRTVLADLHRQHRLLGRRSDEVLAKWAVTSLPTNVMVKVRNANDPHACFGECLAFLTFFFR